MGGPGSGRRPKVEQAEEVRALFGQTEGSENVSENVNQGEPRAVTMDFPGGESKPPEVKEPARGRPKGSKNKGAGLQVNMESIRDFIQGLFDILANRLGPEWKLIKSEEAGIDEAASLAAPIARMLQRANLLSTATVYGDGIILLIALVSIIGPRISIMQARKKAKKGGGNIVEFDRPTKRAEEGPAQKGDNKSGSESAPGLKASIDALLTDPIG